MRTHRCHGVPARETAFLKFSNASACRFVFVRFIIFRVPAKTLNNADKTINDVGATGWEDSCRLGNIVKLHGSHTWCTRIYILI